MAGSLNHIIDENGRFTMDYVENMGDAFEALKECFIIIYGLSRGKSSKISKVCKMYNLVDPFEDSYGDDPKKPMSIL